MHQTLWWLLPNFFQITYCNCPVWTSPEEKVSGLPFTKLFLIHNSSDVNDVTEDAKLFARIHAWIYSTTEVVVGMSFETNKSAL